MNYWLLKSEASCYGIDDLKNEPKKTTFWDGVRNYQARNMMRDDMKKGDLAFFYHSNSDVTGIAGIVEIVKAGYPDHTALHPENKHYDPKASEENPRWYMVDVKFKKRFKSIISLQDIRNNPGLEDMVLLRKGNRLSVMPVLKQHWQSILDMV